jgi:tripartite-type tricarboxylate transporter receptor subunit TctC
MIAPSAVMAVNVTLYKSLSYDPLADFVPLALAAQTAFVLVVNPDLPIRSVPEFIAYVKARPGQLSYATAGPGTPHHLFVELLKSMTGMDITPVAYRGSLPALNDVVAGHVPMSFVDVGPAQGLIAGGKLRPLAVSTATRLPFLSGVPPMKEAGVPGFEASSWQMIAAPAKTPRPVVDKLHNELKALLATAEIQEQLHKNGMLLPTVNTSLQTVREFNVSEIERWGKVVRQAGIEGTQ